MPMDYTIVNMPLLDATIGSYKFVKTLSNEMYKNKLINLKLRKELNIDTIICGIGNITYNFNNQCYLQARKEKNVYQRCSNSAKRIFTYHTKGLVQGENLSSINNHFHWYKSAIIHSQLIYGKCEDQYYFIAKNGDVYFVDNKNVILDHSESEKNIASWYAKKFCKNIHMLPRVLEPKNIKTADFVDISSNTTWEIKEPEGNTIGTTLPKQFKAQKEKAHHFIIDMHNSNMDMKVAINEINLILSNPRYSWIEEVILLNNLELIAKFKQKKAVVPTKRANIQPRVIT